MSVKRKLLLFSSPTVPGSGYLEFAKEELKSFLSGVSTVLFIPYAAVRDIGDMDRYTQKVKNAFKQLGIEVQSVHESSNPSEAVSVAQALFVGGGNTFQLLKALYDHGLIPVIRKRVLEDGMPYIGSSAGSNVATASICTTNDMPIVYPPSFSALQLVPFNINPHYIDADPSSKHMGETREDRINEYHKIPETPPVLGLREGSILFVSDSKAVLRGVRGARLFQRGSSPGELDVGADVSFLL